MRFWIVGILFWLSLWPAEFWGWAAPAPVSNAAEPAEAMAPFSPTGDGTVGLDVPGHVGLSGAGVLATRGGARFSGFYYVGGLAVVCLGLATALVFLLRRQSRFRTEYRALESIYREAIRAAGAVPYRKNLATDLYAFMGDGIEPLTGYTAAEMTPALWRSLILEEVRRGQSEAQPSAPSTLPTEPGRPRLWQCDLRIRTRSGEERWVADSSTQALGPEGKPTAWVGMIEDITESKRIEKRSRQRQRVLELIATDAALPVVLKELSALWERHIAGSTCCIAIANGAGRLEFLPPSRSAAVCCASPALCESVVTGLSGASADRSQAASQAATPAWDVSSACQDPAGGAGKGAVSMTLPIEGMDGHLLGVVCGCAQEVRPLDAKQSDTARLVVSLARLAIERQMAGEAHRGRAERLREVNSRLVELARSPSIGGGQWDDAVRELTEAGARATQAARVSVWLLSPDGAELRCEDEFDLAAGRHRRGECLLAAQYPAYFEACATSRIIASRDAATDPRTREFRESYLEVHGITSMLDAPIRHAGRQVGMVSLEHIGPMRDWTHEEELFAASLADFVVLALQARERRRAEEQVRQLNVDLERRVAERTRETQRQAFAMDSITEGMGIARGDRFVYVNPALAAIFGYAPLELRGQHWHRLCAPEEGARIVRETARALDRDRFFRFEAKGLRKDGSPLDVEFNLTVMTSGELVCACRDITERKRTDAELRRRSRQLSQANGELARAARLKDEFLANMSHELRTPLVSILGLAEALQSDYSGSLNSRQHHYVRTIEESGRHLLQLINDVLDIAKTQAGRIRLQLELCDVAEVCESALRLVKQCAHAKNQRVSVTIEPPGVRCVADARRLKQILVNLLSNAVKFTPENGQVGLAVEGDEANRKLRLVVWDTGVGIAAEDLALLFKPFVQVDHRLGRSFGGTGLGLVLVRRMTELHGGHVQVESTPGAGSRFSVVLPWRTKLRTKRGHRDHPRTEVALAGLPAAASPRSPSWSPPPGQRLLVVEDNEATLLAFTDFLAAHGYQVDQARNGSEALTRMNGAPPSLILLDIQMPGIDGLEVIRRLRHHEDPALRTIPILALTALAMPGDAERCLEAGANAYLAKPVTLLQLLEAIEQHLLAANAASAPA